MESEFSLLIRVAAIQACVWALLMLDLGCAGQTTGAEEGRPVPAQEPAAIATHVAGQVIVKFQPEAAAGVERIKPQGGFPAVGIKSLEVLFSRFGITACERVFPDRPDQTQDSVGLNRLYLCTLDPSADVEAAVQAFSRDPNVEYAEPNYIATLHSEIDTQAVGE